MQYLWIIEKSSSAALFYKSYSELQIDPDLVSGLLAALNNFSEVELKSRGIESIDMGGLRWTYVQNNPLNLLLIAADLKSSNAEVNRSRLIVIEKMFTQMYNIQEDTFKQKLININEFVNFSETIDVLRDQWIQAEKVMGAAALFDFLGVFQQLLNILTDMVRSHFEPTLQQCVFEEFRKLVVSLPQLQDVLHNPELQSITFDSQQGWNIIALNPIMLDGEALKRTLFYIVTKLKKILLEYMGELIATMAFNEEIIPYLLQNWDLLENLHITKSLISIFVEK
jgi:hypothetical protein